MPPDEIQQLINRAQGAGRSAGAMPEDVRAMIDRVSAIDTGTGAPIRVRAAVGAAQTPQDRLATIRQYYPDAQPYGSDNFVFRSPRTGRPTLYNEEGWIPSVGDLLSIGPEISEVLGSVAGAGAGLIGAPATGGASAVAVPVMSGIGAAGAREGYNALARGLLGTSDTRSLPERLTDTAVTGGANAVGYRAGELLFNAASGIFGPVSRAIRGPQSQPGQAVADFANANVEPTAGAVTGNRGMQIIEHALSNMPGSASVMQQTAERQIGQAGTEARRMAQVLAGNTNPFNRPLTTQGAGDVIQTGAREAGNRFAARADDLYNQAVDAIGADTNTPLPRLMKLASQMRAELDRAPTSQPGLGAALSRIQAIIDDAQTQGGGLPFDTVRRIRTDIGREIDSPLAAAGLEGGNTRLDQLRRAYGPMSEDITATAQAAGPDAARALAVADRYTRFHMTRNAPLLRKISETMDPEQAYSFALGTSRAGDSRLADLRRNLLPEEWDQFAGTVLESMGLPTAANRGAAAIAQAPEEFSVNTFLTNWNRMSPEARRQLFGGRRYFDLGPELDNFVRVVDRLKDADRMRNPSGTARNLIAGLGIGAVGTQAVTGDPQGAASTAVGAILAPRLAAQLITNPRFVRWLAGATPAAQQSPGALSQWMGRLSVIAEAEPELRDAINQFRATVAMPEGLPQRSPQ